MSQPRLHDIDQAKGLAIFLVVLGHICPQMPAFLWLRDSIYIFHMHFFMFLSGLVTFYSYRPVKSLAEYRQYAVRRFLRLIPAYVLFALLIIAGKLVLQPFLYVSNLPRDFRTELADLLFRRDAGPVVSLWYIYVLFIYQLVIPVLLWASRGRIGPWVILGLALHFVHLLQPVTDLFHLFKICYYAFPFFAGGWVAKEYPAWREVFGRCRASAFLLLTIAFLCRTYLTVGWPVQTVVFLLLTVPALMGLVQLGWVANSRLLSLWSRYTLAIYLMHLIAIGLVKGGLLAVTSLEGWRAVLAVPVLLVIGLAIPVFLKTKAFRYVPWLDRITT